MSDEGPGCFGKLPFALIDELQRASGNVDRYWADAVLIPGAETYLSSIDSISLDAADLSGSALVAILHGLNDIYAANGIPRSFSISLVVPADADFVALSDINREIARCAAISGCELGKLHTSRASGLSTATVAAFGILFEASASLPKKGTVRLVGNYAGGINRPPDPVIASNLSRRRDAVKKLRGPKKDVSGDGLAGALVQLAKRFGVDINVRSDGICRHEVRPASPISERNYFDYATSISGLSNPSVALLEALFSPRVFGPLICLTDVADDVDHRLGIQIGSFGIGHGLVVLN